MPIDRRKSKGHIIGELINTYKKTGKIGNTKPKNLEHARQIAAAIAYNETYNKLIERLENILDG